MASRSFLLALTPSIAIAHICLLSPVQRGGFNISDPGDYTCFQPAAPCGGKAASAPVQLVGGQGVNIVFQQNLNHYNPGHPGFLDVAWAPFPEPPSDDNFTVLAVVPDYWAHLQAAQTNFSVPVILPNVDIAHAVLRVRYHPNKPTEPVFHQCADISIVASASPDVSPPVYAFANPRLTPSTTSLDGALVQIQANGTLQRVEAQLLAQGVIPVDGMITSVAGRIYTVALYAADVGSDAPAAALVAITPGTGTPSVTVLNITLPPGDPTPPSQWTAIVAAPHWAAAPLVLLGLAPAGAYTWTYQARQLDPTTGVAGPVLAASIPTDTYVNFFQATDVAPTGAGPTTGIFYFLAGDENTLTTLDALIYTASLDTKLAKGVTNMTAVQQDISAFTLSGMTVDLTTGAVYAVSPGLFGSTDYSLVRVNASSGAVSPIAQLLPGAGLDFTYSGNVYGRAIGADGSLLHVFRRALDGSHMLASIDIATGAVTTAPTLITGVNNEIALHSITRVA